MQVRSADAIVDLDGGSLVDTLCRNVRRILDDHTFHRLTDEGDVILIDRRQYCFTHVIGAVRQEDLRSFRCLYQRQDERSRIAGRKDIITRILIRL